ncbi:sortase [Microcella sp.]|uniref:sortase n=1 Tax=Microcella sp. TaxID=1913979 RepID=UPI00391C030F
MSPTDLRELPRRLHQWAAGAWSATRSSFARASNRFASDNADLESVVDRAAAPLSPLERARFGSTVLLLLGSTLLAFAAYVVVISPVTHARDQHILQEELRFELANSTSPVSQTGADGELLPLGTPIALLEIPTIDLRTAVVEGTTSYTLQSAPGHRRDTVMPGQQGASVIFGRQAAFGGPFANLGQLSEGDRIEVTTGQGTSTYRVVGVRVGQEELPDRPAADGTLTLVTATGLPFFAMDTLRVDAVLIGDAFEAGARAFTYAALPDDELAMASQSGGAAELALYSLILLAAVALVPFVRRYWGRWQAWVVASPLLAALAFLLFREASALLPNLT